MYFYVKSDPLYSREQSKKLREQFWTRYGQYMAAVPAAEGIAVNWINYKTGLKFLSFRMEASQSLARISIDITHSDAGIRKMLFSQLQEYRNLLYQELQEEWTWTEQVDDGYGKTISRVEITLANVSVFNMGDWPALISFFKPRIIALDRFWSTAQYGFEMFK